MAGPTLRLNIDATGAQRGADQFSNATDKVTNKSKQAGSAVDQMGGRIGKMGQMTGQQRFIFQNTANQLGDIAVQASMGTNIFRVLGMQIPQIAGGFALLGGAIGIAAGVFSVIAAVGFPIIAMFTSMGKESKSAADQLDDLADKIAAAKDAADEANTPLSELDVTFGLMAESIKNARQELQELTLAKLVRDLDEASDELAEFASNSGIFERIKYGSEQFGAAQRKLVDQLGATNDEADRLVQAFADLEGAFEPEDQAAAYAVLFDALKALNPVTDEQKDAQYELAKSALEGRESAARLVEMLKDLEEQIETVNNTPLNIEIGGPKPTGGRGTVLPTAADLLMMRMGGEIVDKDGKEADKTAENARKKEMRELEAFAKKFKPVLDATTEYNQNMEKLNRAREIGAITEAQHAQATAVATQQYQIATGEAIDYTSAANALANSLTDSLMMLADGTSSVKDAFKSMAQAVIKELYRVLVVQTLVNSIMGAFGFSPAMGGGYVPTGGAGAYGGPVEAGKGIVVGERGPEVFYPSMNGTLQPNGGGDVIVNQTINVSTGVQQTVRTEIRSLMPEIANSAKSAVVDAKRRGGGYGRAFA